MWSLVDLPKHYNGISILIFTHDISLNTSRTCVVPDLMAVLTNTPPSITPKCCPIPGTTILCVDLKVCEKSMFNNGTFTRPVMETGVLHSLTLSSTSKSCPPKGHLQLIVVQSTDTPQPKGRRMFPQLACLAKGV